MHKKPEELEQENPAFPGIDFIQVEIDGESHRIDFESACFVRSLAGSFLDIQGGSTLPSPLNLAGKNMAKIKNLTVSLQLDSANFLQIMSKLATVLDSTSKDEQVHLIGEIAQLLTDSVVVKPAITNKLESIDSELKLLHKVAQNIEKRFVDADKRAIQSLQLMGRLDLGTQIREVGTQE